MSFVEFFYKKAQTGESLPTEDELWQGLPETQPVLEDFLREQGMEAEAQKAMLYQRLPSSYGMLERFLEQTGQNEELEELQGLISGLSDGPWQDTETILNLAKTHLEEIDHISDIREFAEDPYAKDDMYRGTWDSAEDYVKHDIQEVWYEVVNFENMPPWMKKHVTFDWSGLVEEYKDYKFIPRSDGKVDVILVI